MVNGVTNSGTITDYRDLDVWKEAMTLTVDIYEATRLFPREEMFGLTAQMRRAASSIPANIAEGFGRQQTRSFIQFLRIAQGSLKELETHIEISARVTLVTGEQADPLRVRCDRIGRMLTGLVRSLERKVSIR
jgi:four helix bundle protein